MTNPREDALAAPERPEHIAVGTWSLLKRQAARSWHLFGEPILLAGSAVRKAEPRDWDIRINLPDDVFAARYGDVKEWERTGSTGEWTEPRRRWSDDMVHHTRKWAAETHLNIDFQVYPASWAARFSEEAVVVLESRSALQAQQPDGDDWVASNEARNIIVGQGMPFAHVKGWCESSKYAADNDLRPVRLSTLREAEPTPDGGREPKHVDPSEDEILRPLSPYLAHDTDCSYLDMGRDEPCNCGLHAVKTAVLALLREAQQPAGDVRAGRAIDAIVEEVEAAAVIRTVRCHKAPDYEVVGFDPPLITILRKHLFSAQPDARGREEGK